MADSGEVREVVEKLLEGFVNEEEDDPLQKVKADHL